MWQIYSNLEQLRIFDSPTTIRVLTNADELAGDPVVPGFAVPIAKLFPLAEPLP